MGFQSAEKLATLLTNGACLHLQNLPDTVSIEMKLVHQKIVRRLHKDVVRRKNFSGKVSEVVGHNDLRVFMDRCRHNMRVVPIRQRIGQIAQRKEQAARRRDASLRKCVLHRMKPAVSLYIRITKLDQRPAEFDKRLRALQNAKKCRLFRTSHQRVAKRHRCKDAGVQHHKVFIVARKNHFACLPKRRRDAVALRSGLRS